MEHSPCRAQFIAKYFSELQGDVCKMCDICQKGMTHQIKDFTNEAKNTSMIVIQSKTDKYDCNPEQGKGQCTGNDVHGFQSKRNNW